MNRFAAITIVALSLVPVGVVAQSAQGAGERIDVSARGIVKTGVMAIGGETTGVTITADGMAFELQLQPKDLEKVRDLDGRRVVVQGRLTQRRGVERRERLVIEVRSIKAAALNPR